MKKVLMGCGIAFLIVLIIVAYVGYRVYRFTHDVVIDVKNIREQYHALNVQIPFDKPNDDLISSDRFDIWIKLRVGLSEEMDDIINTIEHFSIESISRIREQTFEMADLFAESLETVFMSPAEYIWITRQAAGVLNSGEARANPEMDDLITVFDELQEDFGSANNEQKIRSLEVPVTNSQIIRTCKLLLENKEPFLSSIKVFYADVVVFALVEDADQDNQNEVETAELYSSAEMDR